MAAVAASSFSRKRRETVTWRRDASAVSGSTVDFGATAARGGDDSGAATRALPVDSVSGARNS